MSKTKILLVRHGQSEGNFRREFLGHTDLPLTELGRLQAECTARFLDSEKIDAIYSSDLKRAYQTAEPIAVRQGLNIIKNPRMREIFAGKWDGLSVDCIFQLYGSDFAGWRNDIGNVRCTGGESVAELWDRVYSEVQKIAKNHPSQTICIASHATPIRALTAIAEGKTLSEMQSVPWSPNASVTVLSCENGVLSLISEAKYAHLGEKATGIIRNEYKSDEKN